MPFYSSSVYIKYFITCLTLQILMSLITILDWEDCTEVCIRERTCAGCGHITTTWCNSGFEGKCKGLYNHYHHMHVIYIT